MRSWLAISPTVMRLPIIQPRHAAIILSLQLSADEQLRADWSAAFATQENEFDHVELHPTPPGSLPDSLCGTLFKNGPARFSRGDDEYAHWLDGDGFVTALNLEGGAASWSGRFVRTEAFAEEEEAGKVTYRTTFGTQRTGGPLANALDIRLKSPANTNVLPLATGSLLALWEAGPPYELDATTLDCVGASDLGGRLTLSATHGALPGTTGAPPLDRLLDVSGLLPLTDAVSAHPRRDAAAGVVVAWAWRQELVGDAIEVTLHTLPEQGGDAGGGKDGGTGASARIEAVPPVRGRLERTAFAPHDMGLSGRFALFLTAPTRVDVLPFIAGLRGPAQCATFDAAAIAAGQGATVHMVSRDGGGTSRYSLAEPYHAVHHANAWEGADGATTHLLCSCWPPTEVRRLAAAGRDLLGSWEELQSGDFSDVPTTHLTHIVLDHASRQASARPFLAGCAQLDHPQVHPHFEGQPTRYVYASMGSAGEPDGSGGSGGTRAAQPRPIQSFVVVDVSDEGGGRIVDQWHAGTRRFVDEVAIVPRERRPPVGRAGAAAEPERDAWLIAPIFDGATNTTSYVVLDAADLAAGPVCELPLPTHIPWGLHGAWLPPGGGAKL